jgi:hypothetical protein
MDLDSLLYLYCLVHHPDSLAHRLIQSIITGHGELGIPTHNGGIVAIDVRFSST